MTIIGSNRSYNILNVELLRAGVRAGWGQFESSGEAKSLTNGLAVPAANSPTAHSAAMSCRP